jgi:hypothetical protein
MEGKWESSNRERRPKEGPIFLHATSIALFNFTPMNIKRSRTDTYWITIQLSVYVILVAFITLIVLILSWKPEYQAAIFWGSGVVIQLALAGWYFAGLEIYRNVYYLEHDLRQMIQGLVGPERFWQYETFLAKKSNKIWTDVANTGCFVIAYIAAITLRHALCNKELIGVLVNLPFTVFLIFQTVSVVRLRRKLEREAGSGNP